MKKTDLIQIVIDQKLEPLPSPMVQRWQYTRILPLVDNKQVIVISGIRRCGKSTLMQMLRTSAPKGDYYINFDDDRLVNFELSDFNMLLEVFVELYGEQNTFYFDEIQNILGWEKFVRRLHNGSKKVFVTGSNAKLLSSELGTHLTGRHINVKLYPYSFREYITYRDQSIFEIDKYSSAHIALIKKYLAEYKVVGGMPEYLINRQRQYLHSLYESIIYKDIIVRNKLTLEKPILELVHYLASNNAKEFSYNSLRKLLGLGSANTVSEYCHYLQNSFLCFTVNRFAYSLKQQLNSPKKIYFIDQALAESVGFRFSEDNGRTLENIVFLQLLRQNKEIYYHKQKKECDFIIRDKYEISEAIQVCTDMQDKNTRKREIDGLLEALAAYSLPRGCLITEDESGVEQHDLNGVVYTIEIIPCWQWLLSE